MSTKRELTRQELVSAASRLYEAAETAAQFNDNAKALQLSHDYLAIINLINKYFSLCQIANKSRASHGKR